MGAWGVELFEDDVAGSVQDIWEDAVAAGGSPAAASGQVMEKLGGLSRDPDDGPIFWLALASLQLDAGSLDAEVKQKALDAIAPNLEGWRTRSSPDNAAERVRVLEDLRARLVAA